MAARSSSLRSCIPALCAVTATAVCIAGCNRAPSSQTSLPGNTTDKYAEANMKYGAPPAVVTTERHAGAFAQGAALSMEPAVAPVSETASNSR